MAKFYVVTKSNWQGDSWKVAAGPFLTRQEAEAEASKHEQNPIAPWSGAVDIKRQIHAKVMTRTELNAIYGRGTEAEAAILEDQIRD